MPPSGSATWSRCSAWACRVRSSRRRRARRARGHRCRSRCGAVAKSRCSWVQIARSIPTAGSVAEAIKYMTGGRGADVCIEVSGATPALADAIRAVAYSSPRRRDGLLPGRGARLVLGDEFHHNRVELICSQISGVSPAASHRWTKPRLWRTAVALQYASAEPAAADHPYGRIRRGAGAVRAARCGRTRHVAVGPDFGA